MTAEQKTVQNFKPKEVDDARKCIVNGQLFDKSQMLRFVLSPDNMVTPDVKCKLPGRGAWVNATHLDVEEAIAKNIFKRSFKQKVEYMDGTPALISDLLRKDVLDILSICRKTGDLQMGHLKAEESILSGRTRIYIVASDAGTDTRKKLTAKLRTIAAKKGKKTYIIDHFSSAELVKCLGHEKIIHVAIKSGSMANLLLANIEKWDRYNGKQNMITIIGE